MLCDFQQVRPNVQTTKKQKASEIDDIFSSAKKGAAKGPSRPADGKNQETKPQQHNKRSEPYQRKSIPAEAPAAKKPKVQGSKDDIFGEDVGKGSRKRTEEGYAIYTEDELGFGKKGGDTDLCPFDCDCCF